MHLHTEYSFLDGFTKVWDTPSKEPGTLIKRLKEIDQHVCAITDHGSISGWVRFNKACNVGEIKPIFGCEGYFCNDINIKGLSEEKKLEYTRGVTNVSDKKKIIKGIERQLGLSRRSHFCVWAMNETGIYEIQKTLSIASTKGFYYKPRWDFKMIQAMKNCIFSSACMGGILGYQLVNVVDKKEGTENWVTYYKNAWEEASKWVAALGDRFYIELMPIDMPSQTIINKAMYKIAQDLNITCIMTNDSHYPNPEDWEAHDVLLALQSFRLEELLTKDVLNDPNRMRYQAHDLYIKDRKTMIDDFVKRNPTFNRNQADIFCDNTLVLGDRCNAHPIKKSMIMPKLSIPKEYNNDLIAYFKQLIKIGWNKKIVPYVPKEKWQEYKERLKYEMNDIIKQGFTPYFILVNHLMKWTDSQGIARGPARGSSAGSLVAYLLSMTMVDPIPHKLLFSRFIDPNRTDFPDVDMDFEDARRHEVVQYFINTYGKNNVAILGNNMTFKARMALADVARMFKVNLNETRKVSELVVQRSGADSRLSFCLEDTFNQHEFAKAYRDKYPKVCKIASQLEGLVKSVGTHAAAVVIGDGNIYKYTGVRKSAKKDVLFPITTIDKHDAEDIGLLKMDVLGLNTMTIINEINKLIQLRHGKKIDLESLCRDVSYHGGDKDVYKEFAEAHTTGIFQFMSPGLTRLAHQMKIDKFSEISDATALHRPGPIHSGAMNNYPAYKFGKAKAEHFEHPIIKKWTDDTYGLVIYQEQVMQIVRELGDFDWAQTNTVRKVMSKSGGAEYFMKNFWPTWRDSCKKKGMEEKLALKAFHRIMSFGSWAFNLSHSVSYALVSYISMWFKVHYPLEFVTAYLNYVNDTGGEKIKDMIREAHRMGIEIREPDINLSGVKFVISDKAIVAGLSDIKHVGEKAVEAIVAAQPFTDIIDFIKRVNSRSCNKRTVEHLVMGGAFDSFSYNKKKLLEHLEEINQLGKKGNEAKLSQARALLDTCMGDEELTEQEEAQMKSNVSPIQVGKHITEYYADVIAKFGKHIKVVKLKDIIIDEGEQQKGYERIRKEIVYVYGLVTQIDLKRLSQEVKEIIDKEKEQRYALTNLEDETDFCVTSFRGKIYEKYEQQLFSYKNKVVLIRGSVNVGFKKIYVEELWTLDELRAHINSSLKPYNFRLNYLFQHPLHTYFSKLGGIDTIRRKFKCKALKEIVDLQGEHSYWTIVIIKQISPFKIKKVDSKYYGKRYYRIYVEDDTYSGSLMIYPGDKSFKNKMYDLIGVYKSHEAVMMFIQKDLKFKTNMTSSMTISMDKRLEWKDLFMRKFQFKKKG